jgi:biotin synthase
MPDTSVSPIPSTLDRIEAPDAATIRDWSRRIAAGTMELSSAQARSLLEVAPGSEAAAALFAGSQAVREAHLGKRVRFCSILNAKAGGCSENCSYCAQASGSANDDYDRHRWLPDEEILQAAESAAANGAEALGLVAAWKGVKKGKQLDMVVEAIKRLSDGGKLRADVNLGILESPEVAKAIAEAGAKVYGHNLETARSFFEDTCTTHDFEERWQTIQYIKEAGMGLCSGGIVGMGENRDQRIEFAEQLRFIEPDMIPINFLNPLPGTPYENHQPVDVDEALITLEVFRLFLPDRNIMVAGGKEVTFGERLGEVFSSGINAVMVGNYLTTLGTDPEFWHRQVRLHGLERVDETLEDGCGSGATGGAGGCGCS